MARTAGLSENRVIVRMLQIAREDLGPFDDAGLRRILREPWEAARKRPSLVQRMRRRSKEHVRAVVAARVTSEDRTALFNVAKKEKTTVSALQRSMIEQVIAKET